MSKGSQQEVGSEDREDGAAPVQATPIIPAEKNCNSLQILRVKAASSKAEQYSCSSRSSSNWEQGKRRN